MSKLKFIFASGFMIVLVIILGCLKSEPEDKVQPIRETRIVNISDEKFDVYIGRGIEYHTHMLAEGIKPGEEGWLGNAHPIGWCDRCQIYHTRDECIERFKLDFYKKVESDSAFKKAVLLLRGKRLGCYCKPENCHGDVVKEWIDINKN